MGIGYLTSLRPRIERLCMRQELNFAERLPDGVLAAQRGLALPDSTREQAAFLDRKLAVIRSWGWLQWVVHVIERAARRRAT